MRNYWFFLSAICLVGFYFGSLQQCGRSNAVYSAIGKQSLVMVAPTPLCQPIGNSSQQPNRHEFAKKMASLEEGMQSAEVIKTLGQPDDIKTQNDPGGINTNKTKEIWRYGTKGHLTFPTLGQIYINENDQVQYLSGNKGASPETTLFTEQELRCILRILSDVTSYGRPDFNPRPLIRAVNTLQPLGKQKALAAINEYLRVNSSSISIYDNSSGGIFFVLRLLFEIPEAEDYMPTMGIGAWSPRPPKDPKKFPLYPLVLQGDIPFDISRGYILGGLPEQPERHVTYFLEHGVLRKKLLRPTKLPWQAIEKLVKDNPDFSIDRSRLVEQVARLLDSVYEIPDDEKALYGFSLSPDQATHVGNTLPNLHLMWDERFHCYTFDGLVLLRNPQPVYRREIWQPDSSKKDFKIIVERKTQHSVDIFVTRSYFQDDEWNNGLIQVFEPTSIEKIIHKFDLEKLKPNSGSSSWATVSLEAGKSLAFELKGKQNTIKSPVFAP